jgi:hypothetical protein
MLYAEICPKVRTLILGRALWPLTLGHITAYNIDNTILLYKLNTFKMTILPHKNQIVNLG